MDHKQVTYDYLRSLGEQIQAGKKSLGESDTLKVLSMLEAVLEDYNRKVPDPIYETLARVVKW